MSNKPNNFPREGLHQPVTKAGLKQLEDERSTLNAELHYTIGGEVQAAVHSNLEAERETAITNGHRRLLIKSSEMNHSFQSAKPDARTEYIRMQREAARGGVRPQKNHVKSQNR